MVALTRTPVTPVSPGLRPESIVSMGTPAQREPASAIAVSMAQLAARMASSPCRYFSIASSRRAVADNVEAQRAQVGFDGIGRGLGR